MLLSKIRSSSTPISTSSSWRYYSSNQIKSNPLFDKILISNRGEIACRVMKTAKKLGIKTVAVYSEADKNSMHVQLADEAYWIGEPESSKSYLRAEKILEIAKLSKAQAIHPGYGFLSENPKFANLCEKEGVVFIGPPATAIVAMGSKSESKRLMEKAKVPIVPGYHGDEQGEEFLSKEAEKIGFPVLIKAVMGGGGKGMRIVKQSDEFINALRSAKREAISSFGDDRVIIEKYITKPRHIEFQVFGDKHGNYVYLFERDCSVQRRHQKIIEEAPAPGMDPKLRQKMGQSAVDAARAVGYVGAGTVEFIVDADNPENYYFMEMNTRLQVEHPVTEMITRQDLVEWQIQVASGNRLPLLQDDLKIIGHSFETRIYAENPDRDFLPGTGKLNYLRAPQEEENSVRVETGVRQGDQVSIYYDPMIAKLVVWAEDREKALKKLKTCLDKYHISGLHTNIEFLKRLCMHPEFRSGHVETHFIQKNYDTLFPKNKNQIDDRVFILSAANIILQEMQKNISEQTRKYPEDSNNPFARSFGLRLNSFYDSTIVFQKEEDGKKVDVSLGIRFTKPTYVNSLQQEYQDLQVTLHGNTYNVRAKLGTDGTEVTAFINQEFHRANIVNEEHNKIMVFTQTIEDGKSYTVELKDFAIGNDEGTGSGGVGKLKSPMPGKVVKLLTELNKKVKKNEPLIVVEAMKMEHTITAPQDGYVVEIRKSENNLVQSDEVLIIIAPEPAKQE